MTVNRFTPEGLLQPVPYAHVTVSSGSRQILMAGQTARPADGSKLDGVALDAQVSGALRQIGIGLAAAGGTFADVTRLTFYVVDWDASKVEPFMKGFTDVVDELSIPDPLPPFTMIGVAALWEPDLMVEIEVNATID